MKLKGKELKRIARGNLLGNYKITIVAMLLTYICTSLLDLISSSIVGEPIVPMQYVIYYFVVFLVFLVGQLFTPGNTLIQLNIARKKPVTPGQVFYGFKNHPDRYIIASILVILMSIIPAAPLALSVAYLYYTEITVQTILLCIAGYIISIVLLAWLGLSVQLMYYLLLDNEHMSAAESIKQSFLLMKGNKGRLLYIMLSFIGIVLAAALSFGIGLLWVLPYMNQTFALFYLDLIGELKPAEAPEQTFTQAFNQYV